MHITGLVDELSKFFDVASMPKPHEQVMRVQGKTRSAAAPAVTIMRCTLNQYLGLLLLQGTWPSILQVVDSHSRVVCAEQLHEQQPPSL